MSEDYFDPTNGDARKWRPSDRGRSDREQGGSSRKITTDDALELANRLRIEEEAKKQK